MKRLFLRRSKAMGVGLGLCVGLLALLAFPSARTIDELTTPVQDDRDCSSTKVIRTLPPSMAFKAKNRLKSWLLFKRT